MGAFRLYHLWDWQGAEEAFDHAMEMNPNVTGILGAGYLSYLIYMGRSKEAIVEAERRLELDPLSFATRNAVGFAYLFARQFEKSNEIYQRTTELNPENPWPYSLMAENYYLMGKYDKSHENRLVSLKLFGEAPEWIAAGVTPEWIAAYDSLYGELGYKAWPTVRLRQIKKERFKKFPSNTAGIYTKLGETQKALDWLEIAYKTHCSKLIKIKVNPGWDPLRGEPRFQAILKRMDFPD